MPCMQLRQTVPEAAKQPQNISEPPPRFTVGTVFFSLNASFLLLKTVEGCALPKSSILVSSVHILPDGFWLSQVSFGELKPGFFEFLCQQWGTPGSPTLFIQMATDSVSWHCSNLSLSSTSREISYWAIGCKCSENVVDAGTLRWTCSLDIVHAFLQFWFLESWLFFPQLFFCVFLQCKQRE